MGYLVRLIDANKILLALISIFLISTLSVYAQERIDVIYLTNGDIARGVIIENVPNEYVKIKFPNGSILTLRYSEIEKFTVEFLEPEHANPKKLYGTNYTAKKDLYYNKGKATEFSVDIRAGLFIPSESAMKDIYGEGIIWGAGISIISEEGFGGEFEISYFTKTGEPIEIDPYSIIESSEANIKLLSIPFSGIYRIESGENSFLTFGAGFGYFSVSENISMTTYYGVYEGSFNKSSFGFQIFCKFNIGMGLIRLSFTSAKVKGEGGAGGSDVEIGGLSIMAGISF